MALDLTNPARLVEAIEAYVTVGMAPCDDEVPVTWLARYEAYAEVPGGGFLVAHRPDPEAELVLQVLSPSGVVLTIARFDLTTLGLAMFVAAAEAMFS